MMVLRGFSPRFRPACTRDCGLQPHEGVFLQRAAARKDFLLDRDRPQGLSKE
jgi:hypothetical protein